MIYLLVYLLVTAIIILIPNRRVSLFLAGATIFLVMILSSAMAFPVLFNDQKTFSDPNGIIPGALSNLLVCDRLSAFFIIVINFTVLTGFLFSIGYLKSYLTDKPQLWIKLHYLSLIWLHASMILVTLFRNGFCFLVVWEIMTLSSFILVVFDFDVKGTIKAGINYLIQMHIGMFFILGAFLMSSSGSNTVSFDNLALWFAHNPNWPVFLLFFIGFGLKAGFFLLHTWLPEAHPAAPSHVSGIMSGVMIKLGIYGILRVTTYLQNDLTAIGATLIIYSAVTGLYGVMMAILQHDIKKLLAYHSIENIGIIGIGIGLGIFGTSIGNQFVAAAGYAGALLHTLNHSLFKSLLFYSAGSATTRLHTRDVEKMGGLIRFMPYTAIAFLIGAIAISGLPPFNGFVSEFLIYTSLFNGLGTPDFYPVMIFFVSMVSLVLIGGLAIFCFTKVFGIVFLGEPRRQFPEKPVEVKKLMLIANLLPVIPIVVIGFLPFIFVKPLFKLTGNIFGIATDIEAATISEPMIYISIAAFLLLTLVLLLALIRFALNRKRVSLTGPTWGCGYTSVDAKQQYTATSFVQEYAQLVNPVIKTGSSNIIYKEDELFPGKRDFHTHSEDSIRSKIINRPVDFLINLMRKAAIFQTGKLQHYVLYALLFLLFIILLTFFKLI